MTRIESIRTYINQTWVRVKRFGKSLLKPEHMQEKRTYLFETEEGEKYNPFSDVTDGAEDDDEEWKYSPHDFN